MKNKIEWEDIAQGTQRLRVYGGWLVQYSDGIDQMLSVSLVFIPDPDNKWKI